MRKLSNHAETFVSLSYLTDDIGIGTVLSESLKYAVSCDGGNDKCHADAHIECVEHISLGNTPGPLYEIKDRKDTHRSFPYHCSQFLSDGARNILIESASGYIADAVDSARLYGSKDRIHVDVSWRK